MSDSGYIGNISVYKDKNFHVLIQINDPFWRSENKYFDLHNCEKIYIEKASLRNELIELSGREKHKAFDIYQKWKYKGSKDQVKDLINLYFPLNSRRELDYEQGKEKSKNIHAPIQDKGLKTKKLEPIEKLDETIYSQKQNPSQIFPEDKKRVISNQKITREQKIKSIIEKQEIETLIHFTPMENLVSILNHGLISRDDVERLPNRSEIKINDENRFDNRRDAICLSIEFPNYRMFYKYHNVYCDEWVVISLKPEILWKYDCAFCHTNAASNECRHIPLEERRKVIAFERLFEDLGNVKRKDLLIPKSFPTNPQAEVLVFNKIPIEDFQKVHFYNWNRMNYYKETYPMFENLFEINRNYFGARQDYRHWQNNQNNYATSSDIDDDNEIPF